MKTLGAISAALLAVTTFSAPASASVVNCNVFPSLCSPIANFSVAGGPHPYVYVSDNNANYLDVANPTQIAFNYNDASIAETAIGSLATGILKSKGTALSVYASYDQLGIAANDIFELSGPAGTVSLTARFRTKGIADLVAVPKGGSILIDGGTVNIELCGPGGSFACGGDTFDVTSPNPFGGYLGPIYSDANPSQKYLEHDYTFTQAVGTPFNIFYAMTLVAYSGSTIDLTDPGSLDFVLPAGYSIHSVSGFPATSAPEPITVALFGMGLAGAVAVRRRTRRQS